MNLPKLDKKMIIAGAFMALVAVGAFAVGTSRGRKIEMAAESTEKATEKSTSEKRAPASVEEKHGEKKDSAHEKKEEKRQPASEHAPMKKPDTLPDSNDDDDYDEEEVDVQIAHPAAKADNRGLFTKFIDTYVDAVQSVNDKVRTIYRAEEENRKLKMENAYLRVSVEARKFSCREEESKKKTHSVGKELATTAGSKAARSLASIRYQFPENLLPEQLHALGVSYFKAKDDEKAAVIMNFLVNLEDDQSFKTADNYLMAGISLYRLENYKSSKEYFDKIEKMPSQDEDTKKAQRQASYWNALVADRLKNGRLAQKIILENLEKDPHAQEARWVNPKGVGNSHKRMPASDSAARADEADKESHHEEKESSGHH